MSAENRWNNLAVDHQSASTGQIYPPHQYGQTMQHANPAAPQRGDEVHLNYFISNLLENNQLRRYHSIVTLYMSLDNASFQSIYQLRMNSPFQPDLSSHHASLFGSPPLDLWNAIIQLRFHSTWPHSQRAIVDALKSRMVQDLQPSRGGLAPHYARRPSQPLGSPSGSSDSSVIGFQPAENPLESVSISRTSPNPSEFVKNNMSKTAPQGQCWRCPSANCKKSFVRMGHLKNHLGQLHPDFLACHPDYDPDDYLELLPPSRTPSDESRLSITSRGAVRTNSQSTIVGSERPRARTRTPSFSPSTGTGSQLDMTGGRQRQRPGMNRAHSDTPGWTNEGMLNEFDQVQGTGFNMAGVPFANPDPFQQPFYPFEDSEDQHMDVDTRQFGPPPPDDNSNRVGSSTSPRGR